METQPLLKRIKGESVTPIVNLCIICLDECDEKQKYPNPEQWRDFREIAFHWKECGGKFGHVATEVSWESGADGYLWHKNCKWKMCNKKTLEQARRSFDKTDDLFFVIMSCRNVDTLCI